MRTTWSYGEVSHRQSALFTPWVRKTASRTQSFVPNTGKRASASDQRNQQNSSSPWTSATCKRHPAKSNPSRRAFQKRHRVPGAPRSLDSLTASDRSTPEGNGRASHHIRPPERDQGTQLEHSKTNVDPNGAKGPWWLDRGLHQWCRRGGTIQQRLPAWRSGEGRTRHLRRLPTGMVQLDWNFQGPRSRRQTKPRRKTGNPSLPPQGKVSRCHRQSRRRHRRVSRGPQASSRHLWATDRATDRSPEDAGPTGSRKGRPNGTGAVRREGPKPSLRVKSNRRSLQRRHNWAAVTSWQSASAKPGTSAAPTSPKKISSPASVPGCAIALRLTKTPTTRIQRYRGYGSDLEKTSAPPTASSRGNGSPALYQMPEQPPPRPMPGIRRPERERPGRVGKVEQPLLLMFWISAPGPTLQAPETMRHPGLSAKSSSAAPWDTSGSKGAPRPAKDPDRARSLWGNSSVPHRFRWKSCPRHCHAGRVQQHDGHPTEGAPEAGATERGQLTCFRRRGRDAEDPSVQQSAGHTGDADLREVQLSSDLTGRRVQTSPQDRLAGDAAPMDPPARPSPDEVGWKIDLLVGLDLSALMVPTETRRGKLSDPCGRKTSFGWVVRGPVDPTSGSKVVRINILQALTFYRLNLQSASKSRFGSFARPRTSGRRPPLPQGCRSAKNAPTTSYRAESGSWTSGMRWRYRGKKASLSFAATGWWRKTDSRTLHVASNETRSSRGAIRRPCSSTKRKVTRGRFWTRWMRRGPTNTSYHTMASWRSQQTPQRRNFAWFSTPPPLWTVNASTMPCWPAQFYRRSYRRSWSSSERGRWPSQRTSKRCSAGSASPQKTPAFTDSCGRSPAATRSKCCKWISSPSVTSAPRSLPSASSSVSPKSSGKTAQKRRMPSDTTSTSTTISTAPAPRRRQCDGQRTSGRYLEMQPAISTSEIGCQTRRSSWTRWSHEKPVPGRKRSSWRGRTRRRSSASVGDQRPTSSPSLFSSHLTWPLPGEGFWASSPRCLIL